MGRCGVRTQEEALALAERIAELPGLRLRGMQAYEGHCMLEPDPDVRVREAHAANAKAIDAVDLLAERGHPVAGRSPAAAPGRTTSPAPTRASHEVQAGSYTLMDCSTATSCPAASRWR